MIQNDDITIIKDIAEIARQEEQLNLSIAYWTKYNRSHHRKIYWKFNFVKIYNDEEDKGSETTLLFYPEGNFNNIEARFRKHVKLNIQKLRDRFVERELNVKLKFITA